MDAQPPRDTNESSGSYWKSFKDFTASITLPEIAAGLALGGCAAYATVRGRGRLSHIVGEYGAWTPYVRTVLEVAPRDMVMPQAVTREVLREVSPMIREGLRKLPDQPAVQIPSVAMQIYNPKPAPFVMPKWTDITMGARATYLMAMITDRELLELSRRCGIPHEPAFVTAVTEFTRTRSTLLSNFMKGVALGTGMGKIYHPVPLISGIVNTVNTSNTALNLVGQGTEQMLALCAVREPTARQAFISYADQHIAKTLRPVTPAVVLIAAITCYAFLIFKVREAAKKNAEGRGEDKIEIVDEDI